MSYIFTEDDFRKQATADGVTHITVGTAVIQNGKVLVVRRAAHDFLGGVYELPGGGLDDGETIVASALRELQEESGIIGTKVLTSFPGFDYKTDVKPHVRQINFLVTTTPGATVILDPNEHDDFQWVDEEQLATLNMTEEMRRCVAEALNLAEQLLVETSRGREEHSR